MENKKTSIIIAIIAIILFVGVTFIFLYEPAKNVFIKPPAVKQQLQEVTGELPVLECNYNNDKEAYKDAGLTGNVNICECIDDEKMKNDCKTITMDMIFYGQALEQFDVALCDKIQDEIHKDACQKVVKSSIEYFDENDPQFLASSYANAHNKNSIEVLEKLIVKDANNVDNLTTLALMYAEKGLHEQEQGKSQDAYVARALKVIEKAKKIDAGSSEVLRIEAYIYEIKPDLDKAIEIYNRSIQSNNNNVLSYAGLGHVYTMLGDYTNAFENFKKADELDVQNEHIPIYANVCRLGFAHSDDHDGAIRSCKIVIASDTPDNLLKSDAYQILSSVYISNGDLTQSKNYLLQAKTLTPNDPNLYNAFSNLNLYEQQYDVAKLNAEKAIELSPTKAASYLTLSHALYMQEKYNESIDAAKIGLSLVDNDVSLLEPNKPLIQKQLYNSIANNYRNLNDEQKQIEYEEKANVILIN